MPLTIRVSEHSHSTDSDRTPSDHTDDEEFSAGVPVDSLSASSQVDYSEGEDPGDEYVHVRYRHVRRNTHGEADADDIDPSDSASRPGTSRQSSQQRVPGGPPRRGQSRRRNPAPDPPSHPRPARRASAAVPRDFARGQPARPESFHSDSLDHDDYPYGPGGGQPYRPPPASGWGHVPRYGGYGDPSTLSGQDPFARQDMMQPYRDPYYDPNPFASQAPLDDFYEQPPQQRWPRPPIRHSTGPLPLMPYGRDPYGYDPWRDPYYGRRPLPPEIRAMSPEMAPAPPPAPAPAPAPAPEPSKPPTPAAAPPPPVPSPGDERLAKLELLIMTQTEENRKRALEKRALRDEEERKKKEADEKTQSEKLISLEKLLLKQNEAAIAREKAMEKKRDEAEATAVARYQKEAAEKSAKDKIDKELKEAADKAKKSAEDEAAKAAAEAKEAADKAAAEAKEASDKELAALKEKHDAAEAAKKAAEEEAEKLKPKGVPPPIKFKDAVGRKFQFPFDICKTWKGMEGLIKQAFLHVDLLGPHVLEGHYDLIGPDGEIILPQVWETMIQPDFLIEMQMWPIPELEKGKHPSVHPGPPPDHPHHPGAPLGPGGLMMPGIDEFMKGLKKDKHGSKVKGSRGGKIMVPPPPPMAPMPGLGGGIPPPPMGGMHGPGAGMGSLAAISIGTADGAGKKKKSSRGSEVPALMRWAAGSKSGKGGKKQELLGIGVVPAAQAQQAECVVM